MNKINYTMLAHFLSLVKVHLIDQIYYKGKNKPYLQIKNCTTYLCINVCKSIACKTQLRNITNRPEISVIRHIKLNWKCLKCIQIIIYLLW